MPLITIENLTIRFRGPMLLDGISAKIDPGQRIGLLGRNGAGKSTLLKILSGEITPDGGQLAVNSGVKIGQLPQEVPAGMTGSIAEVVRGDLEVGRDLSEHWEVDRMVEETLGRMKLDGEAPFETLSSGMKRRVLLAREIAAAPDVLLLDEPTNHLDLEAIVWLEDFLLRWNGTLIFVTHDRSFLRRLATRIWEIDLGKLFDWSCDYDTFRKRKEDKIAAEDKQNALFDKRLSEEETWIRQGIKARRTRNEGRVRALEDMRRARQQRREKVGTAKLQIQEASRGGTLVIEAKGVSFAHGDQVILRDFSTTIMRGDKVGIIGPNGAGKTTLLRLLLGQLAPQAGTIRLGTQLQIAYFDQLRDTLDPEQTVQENVGEGRDTVRIGDRSKHIMGYLQDFLFTPERARTQVKYLSGGERNRALLARLMTQPANVIVMDEPTNDLDSETLDLLEEQLVDFGGTVLLVSHDRTFLNHVVTSTLVFEDDGVQEYVGGYDDWVAAVRRRDSESRNESVVSGATPARSPGQSPTVDAKQRRLSFKDQYELDQLPKRIEGLETGLADLHQRMADPVFFKLPGDQQAAVRAQLADLEKTLAASYERWEQLESLAESGA